MRMFVSAGVLCAGSVAVASPVDFVYTGTGAGSLNGVAFLASTFTIRAHGDNSGVVLHSQGGEHTYDLVHTSASIDIAGLGTLVFTTSSLSSVSSAGRAVYFNINDFSRRSLFQSARDDVFRTWDMRSNVGPISGANGQLLQWGTISMMTDHGRLIFADQTGISSTFTGAVVPAPGVAALWGCAGAAVVSRRRR